MDSLLNLISQTTLKLYLISQTTLKLYLIFKISLPFCIRQLLKLCRVILQKVSFKLNSLSHRLIPNVATRDRLGSFFSCSVHIPALAVTISLLAMNFSKTYYDSVGTPGEDIRLNFLQFAAKLHEVLIVTSLSTVAIDHVQYELLRGKSLSIGGVITSFQITNIACLWEAGLWSRSLTPGSVRFRLRFLLLVGLLIALVTIVGPASAILILPVVGWWELSMNIGDLAASEALEKVLPANYKIPDGRVSLAANYSTLWPTHITEASLAPDCTYINSTTPAHCPAGGFSLLFDQAGGGWFDEYWGVFSWNVTVPTKPNKPTATGRLLSGYTNEGDAWGAVTTTGGFEDLLPLIQVSTTYDERDAIQYAALLWDGSQPLAPQTQIFCLNPPNGTAFPSKIHFPIIDSDDPEWSLEGAQWTVDSAPLLPAMNQTVVHWIEPPYLGKNTPSIAAVLITLRDGEFPPEIEACSVYASWDPVELYLQPSSPYTRFNTGFGTSNASRHVQLDIEWANQALPAEDTLLQLACKIQPKACSEVLAKSSTASFDFYGALGPPLAMIIADAMARTSTDIKAMLAVEYPTNVQADNTAADDIFGVLPVVNMADIDMNNVMELKFVTSRNGYSYSMQGITRRLAAGVFFVYVAVVLVHTTLVVTYRWKRPKMKSLYELLVLAVRSPADQIQEVDRKEKPKPYKYTLNLRQDSGSELELLLQDGGNRTCGKEPVERNDREMGGLV